MMINIKMEQFDLMSVCIQLHNSAIHLAAHGDDSNAKECLDLRDRIRRQMQEVANA